MKAKLRLPNFGYRTKAQEAQSKYVVKLIGALRHGLTPLGFFIEPTFGNDANTTCEVVRRCLISHLTTFAHLPLPLPMAFLQADNGTMNKNQT